MTHTLPHHESERHRSINNIWSCIWGNQGFLRIGAPITKLLTTSLAKNAMCRRQNTYSKIINVSDCKTSKKRSLTVKYRILIMFNYPTAKTRTLYKSTDGPAGQHADNTPNPDGFGGFTPNCTWIGSSGVLTTRTANLATIGFWPGPGPEVTVRNRC
jgi:hypothetical protein